MAAALASTTVSTMSFGPRAVPAATTPGRLVSVASSFGSGAATKPVEVQVHVDEAPRIVAGLHPDGEHDQVVGRLDDPAVLLDHLDPQA